MQKQRKLILSFKNNVRLNFPGISNNNNKKKTQPYKHC